MNTVLKGFYPQKFKQFEHSVYLSLMTSLVDEEK